MVSKSEKLIGKRALITGASSGLGLATAKLFTTEGAMVALNARRKEVLDKVAATIGDNAVVVAGDVSIPETAAHVVAQAIKGLGGLDIVVYAAGIVVPRLLKDMTVEDFVAHLQVNLIGNFAVARAAALHMDKNDGGTIINISSELAHIGMPHYIHYCASKAGVVGLTKAMAAELAPKITVNAVSPGPIHTPMLEAELELFGGTDEVWREAKDRVPLKRFATPEEVAKVVLFLAADAPYATGSIVRVDGGSTAI